MITTATTSTFYPQARISIPYGTKPPRTVLKPPARPIALRPEYLTTTKSTSLIVRPEGDATSAVAYRITDEDDITVFTATGWRFDTGAGGKGREFRDDSGLPLFEVKRNRRFSWGGAGWVVRLPGGPSPGPSSLSPTISKSSSDTSDATQKGNGGKGDGGDIDKSGILATGAPRLRTRRNSLTSLTPSPGNFSLTIVRNAAGPPAPASSKYTTTTTTAPSSNKDNENNDSKLTLEIERHGNALTFFDIVDNGDRKVAEVRESVRHNRFLPLISSQKGYRPVLDVVVTEGVDLSLVALIAVIASDSVFSSNV